MQDIEGSIVTGIGTETAYGADENPWLLRLRLSTAPQHEHRCEAVVRPFYGRGDDPCRQRRGRTQQHRRRRLKQVPKAKSGGASRMTVRAAGRLAKRILHRNAVSLHDTMKPHDAGGRI